MSAGRYIQRSNDRPLPEDFEGEVLIWDIDKTYLETRFSSLKGLARIPFELAVDKANVPGAIPVIRALRRGAGPEHLLRPLYFVSGSPPQIRRILEKKMLLDGVDFDGITFKDQLGLLMARRKASLYGQVGYKLRALLLYRRELPSKAKYLCFGDDTESDAEAFTLFGQVCAGLRGADLEAQLKTHRVPQWEIDEVHALVHGLEVTENPVVAAYIHQWRGASADRLAAMPRVWPTHSYLQTALLLADRGQVAPEAVAIVAKSLRQGLVPEDRIRNQVREAVQRFGVPEHLAALASSPS